MTTAHQWFLGQISFWLNIKKKKTIWLDRVRMWNVSMLHSVAASVSTWNFHLVHCSARKRTRNTTPLFLWATKFTTVIKKMSLLSIFPVHCALSHVLYILSQDEMYSRRGYMDEAFVMSLQFLMKSGSFPKPKFVFPMLVMFVCVSTCISLISLIFKRD